MASILNMYPHKTLYSCSRKSWNGEFRIWWSEHFQDYVMECGGGFSTCPYPWTGADIFAFDWQLDGNNPEYKGFKKCE